MRVVRFTVATAVVAAMIAPGTPAQAASTASIADKLVKAVTVDAINRHLIAFQRIADRNGGQRADPTKGFQDSLAYVEGKVRAAGFDVTLHEFSYDKTVIDAASLTVGTTKVLPFHMFGSPPTPVGGITGRLVVVPLDATPGCQAGDYAGLDVVGAMVLVRRGGCQFGVKEQVAAEAGAKALLFYNNSPGPMGGAVDPAKARIPAVGLVGSDGATLAALAGATVTLDVRDHIQSTVSHNLIAQTKTGRQDNVVMAGAHLDSLPDIPGINENASSVSALLESALKLGGSPKIGNAVRFAWWGADWANTGSAAYLRSLDFEQELDIALYLEFEAIGSRNGGYFAYDGDGSDGLGSGPYGSAQVERAFTGYYTGRGIAAEGTNFPGRGAYSDFIEAGIPTGGLFSGLFHYKTEAQAAKWGGTAGALFDPCNHSACDNLGNINRDLLDVNADAMAFVIGTYAVSTEDVNGVPPRAKRAQARGQAKAPTAMAGGLAHSQ